jgi:CheY-like chemotaxis protein
MVMHILVIDDEMMVLSSLKILLSSKDHIVSTANSGCEGLMLLKSNPGNYDIVLLDLMMPDMSGIEVLQDIKMNPILKDIPVILQTGMSDGEEIAKAKEMGVVCVLHKPHNAKEIRQLLEKILSTDIA